MRGDVVLYRSSGTLLDWVITTFTHGPYVHAAVDMGDGTFVAELSGGLSRQHADSGPRLMHVMLFDRPGVDIDAGIAWLENELLAAGKDPEVTESHEYGWVDIVDDALKVLGQHVILRRNTEWDCSDLVARYLMAAKAAGPLGTWVNEPETISPNDIARAYHVPME